MESSDALQQEQFEQSTQLQVELNNAELELAEIQIAAQEEIRLLELRRRELETATRETIVQFGSVAVPALTSLLSDERSHIRAWAASALGDLGMDAQDAVPFLVNLLTDQNASVSDNARQALARIEL